MSRGGASRPVIPKLPGRIGDALTRAVKSESTNRRAHPVLDGDGKEIPLTTIKANSNHIFYHKLGRVPRGWIVVDVAGPASFANPLWRFKWDKETLHIVNNNAQDVTIALYVF